MNNAEVVNLEPLDRIARLASQNGQDDMLPDWGEILQQAILPTKDFHALDLPERKPVVAPWFLEGDLGFIFGPRGLGKTWLAMELAIRISEGSMAGLWNVPQPRRVLYVDGEMPYDASRSRQLSLAKGEGEMLFLHHEALFHQSGETLNLTSRSIQSSLGDYCTARDVEVVFLDNLSCLFSGVKENDADSWEVIQRWLLELRRRRIAVVFIHHAGRNGLMRGTSRREDIAFWVIQLTAPQGELPNGDSARFVSQFTKNRNCTDNHVPPLEWTFCPTQDGRTGVGCKKLGNMELFRQCLMNGLSSATDIAEEIGLSKGQISKMAKKAQDEGWLRKEGREYLYTP